MDDKKITRKEQNAQNMSVDLETGAQKGVKLQRFDLIPCKPFWELAEHYGKGVTSSKYSERNWEKGYNWSKSYSAMIRHANQFWSGENYDKCTDTCEQSVKKICSNHTGSKHLIAVAWHALALAEFMETHPEKDDRPIG